MCITSHRYKIIIIIIIIIITTEKYTQISRKIKSYTRYFMSLFFPSLKICKLRMTSDAAVKK